MERTLQDIVETREEGTGVHQGVNELAGTEGFSACVSSVLVFTSLFVSAIVPLCPRIQQTTH